MMRALGRALAPAATIVALVAACASLDGLTGGDGTRPATCGNGVLDPGEACDGDACCSPTCELAPATAVCRQPAGGCDVAEMCSGTAATCPADAFSPSTTVCRAATASCDKDESCTGTSAACPADVTSCTDGGSTPSGPCGQGLACTPPDTCSATDAAGCTLTCACVETSDLSNGAPELSYSCTSSCCSVPAVAGKTCTPASAACTDACGSPCTCTGGTWSCPGTCKACPTAAPATGDDASADVGAICAYQLGGLRLCTSELRDTATNKWTCDDSAKSCTGAAVTGGSCQTSAICGDACGQLCNCSGGLWSCPTKCQACPAVDDGNLDGQACLATKDTECTYVTDDPTPVRRCTCKLEPAGLVWRCVAEDACPFALPTSGTACPNPTAICGYESATIPPTTCTCTPQALWSCAAQ